MSGQVLMRERAGAAVSGCVVSGALLVRAMQGVALRLQHVLSGSSVSFCVCLFVLSLVDALIMRGVTDGLRLLCGRRSK